MKEIKGNLFDHIGSADAICITTNGFVKNNGECVMGKGCAKKATYLFPTIAHKLGTLIGVKGNIPIALFHKNKTWIYSFPVKPISDIFDGNNAVRHMKYKFKIGQSIPGWACVAAPALIKQSAKLLTAFIDTTNWTDIIIPRPGCGAGELNWATIKPMLDQYLDDRFSSITF